MTDVLVIGGNHGLGLEWAKYYLKQGKKVTATYHDISKSKELFEIKDPNLAIIECDVTNKNHINSLANLVESFGTIIYNAGTKGYTKKFSTPDENTDEELDLAYKVNCKGLNAVIRAFLPLILKQPQCKIIYMSTGVSSIRDNRSGNYHTYRMTKLAGNQCLRDYDIHVIKKWIENNLDIALRPLLFALSPGLVNIGMGADIEGAMPVNDAIDKMVEVIKYIEKTQDTHGLWSFSGKKIDPYEIPTVLEEYEKKKIASLETEEVKPSKNFLPMREQQAKTTNETNEKRRNSVLEGDQKTFRKIGLG